MGPPTNAEFKPLRLMAWVMGTQGDLAPSLAVLAAAQRRGHDCIIFTQHSGEAQAKRAGIRVAKRKTINIERAGDLDADIDGMVETGQVTKADVEEAAAARDAALAEKNRAITEDDGDKSDREDTWEAKFLFDAVVKHSFGYLRKAMMEQETDFLLVNEVTLAYLTVVRDFFPPGKVLPGVLFVAPHHPSTEYPPMCLTETLTGAFWPVFPKFARKWSHAIEHFKERGWLRWGLAKLRDDYNMLNQPHDETRAPDMSLRLHVMPPLLFEKPADWDPALDVIPGQLGGQWEGPVPAELEAFLEAGDAPVYLGYGSMTHYTRGRRNPQRQLGIALEAAERTGMRFIINLGSKEWDSGVVRMPSESEYDSEKIFLLREAVPHHKLFPRCALVVAHGGSGTVTTVARSGCPHLIVHFGIWDQVYWHRRRQELGIALPGQCLSAHTITGASLAKRILEYCNAPSLRPRCEGFAVRLEQAIRAMPDPTETCVDSIEKFCYKRLTRSFE